ncbi:hypothetical protein QSJ18_19180 [Gordonia sp. ABSL1-1]|uniref:hypothetical protein n=1 Tax=Gordonia sp. ABSL1-1 TaxID=3053923 RepID=UPI0025739B53|nr:hypothetical protein [Gordonia sp. ABSL1-1]MDL9938875.1 hypothetical protein [Gordonia sp. ABSL1-1]
MERNDLSWILADEAAKGTLTKLNEWAWLGSTIAAVVALTVAGVTAYFGFYKDRKLALYGRYDKLATECRTAIAAFSESLVEVSDQAESLIELMVEDRREPESKEWRAAVSGTLGRLRSAADKASMKGLVAQMTCPDDELVEELERVYRFLSTDGNIEAFALDNLLVQTEVLVNEQEHSGPHPSFLPITDQQASSVVLNMRELIEKLRAANREMLVAARDTLSDPAQVERWVKAYAKKGEEMSDEDDS